MHSCIKCENKRATIFFNSMSILQSLKRMKQKYILSFIAVMATVLVIDTTSESHQLHSNTQGAPSSNACTSCHGGSALNSGPGSATVNIVGNPSGYVPGQTYQVEVTVTNSGRSKFGFALSADNGTGAPRGSLANGGNAAVQVVNNYATHTASGVSGSGTKTWTVNWTAPSTAQGNIRFLAYGNATNSSNSDGGDLIYSATTTFLPATTGMAENNALGKIDIFPNPVVDARMNVALDLKNSGLLEIRLFNRNGQTIETLISAQADAGQQLFPVRLTQDVPAGVYYLVMEQNGHKAVKPIFIQ